MSSSTLARTAVLLVFLVSLSVATVAAAEGPASMFEVGEELRSIVLSGGSTPYEDLIATYNPEGIAELRTRGTWIFDELGYPWMLSYMDQILEGAAVRGEEPESLFLIDDRGRVTTFWRSNHGTWISHVSPAHRVLRDDSGGSPQLVEYAPDNVRKCYAESRTHPGSWRLKTIHDSEGALLVSIVHPVDGE